MTMIPLPLFWHRYTFTDVEVPLVATPIRCWLYKVTHVHLSVATQHNLVKLEVHSSCKMINNKVITPPRYTVILFIY